MKIYRIIKTLLIAGAVCISSAMSGQSKDNSKAVMEAANQGKQDLMEVLNSGRDINLGVSTDQLANATVGKPVPKKTLDFDKVQKLSSFKSLSSATMSEDAPVYIVPLMSGGKAVTVVEVAETKEGAKVSGLGGMSMASDISAVMKVSGSDRIVAYEVPNLQTTIYVVNKGGDETYYTSFDGNSIRQPIAVSLLLPAVQAAAEKFQKEYGSVLQKGQLVR